jgi:tetratricopeptide (TPR) repeat protein/uncharacterized protein YhhL (DUF1145 family)
MRRVKTRAENTSRWGVREAVITVALVVLTYVVFGQVASHHFINYDDGQFVFENAAVKGGLSGSSVAWALTSTSIGWYPLTWLSHMLDVQLWGLDAGRLLLTNVLLHAMSVLLLFAALRKLTGSTWRSAIVAALFAIHPMHVESVAWVSERKDVLSTLFAMLALLAYARRGESWRRQLLVAAAIAASLMAKQMYVTLPFLLLLLDVWPLGRLRLDSSAPRQIIPLLREKSLAFLLAIGGCIVAVIGQRNLSAVQSTDVLPLSYRIENALLAYGRYLAKCFWPTDLAVPYPLQRELPTTSILLAAGLLVLITVAAVATRKRAPYLLVGWLWFIGTLVPVIGLVQIGAQSMADRYSYFPFIGLFIAAVWGLADVASMLRLPRAVPAAIATIVIALFAFAAFRQTAYWRSSEALFTHTIGVTPPNPLAEYSLGQALQLTAPDAAIPHLERSIDLLARSLSATPGAAFPEWYPQAYVAGGNALIMKARQSPFGDARNQLLDLAGRHFAAALRLDPNTPHARANATLALQMKAQDPANRTTASAASRLAAARAAYEQHMNDGTAFAQQGRLADAIAEFRKVIAIAPKSPEARIYLALVLMQANQRAEGVAAFHEAQQLDPVAANEFLTKALRLPPNPDNLSHIIAQASQ